MPVKACDRCLGFQKFETSRFFDSRHTKVVCLTVLHTGLLYPHEISQVLTSFTAWFDLWAGKIPVTQSGIEPATFRPLARWVYQLCHRKSPYNVEYYNYLYYSFIRILLKQWKWKLPVRFRNILTFFVEPQFTSGLGRLTFEVSRSHTHTHTHT
jgi:hypothetical protein